MANLDRFVFNSDYPMDKVVFFSYGSTTIPAKSGSTWGEKTVTVQHDLPFIPLPQAVWATSDAFTDTCGVDPMPDKYGMDTVKADSSSVTIKFVNGEANAKTVYYRIYGLMPENATQEAAKNSRQSSALIFDTDKVYAPLIFSGVITEDINTTNVAYVNVTHGFKEYQGQAGRVEIEHNLGRLPYVLFWLESSGTIEITGAPDFLYGFPEQQYNYVTDKKCNFYAAYSDGQSKWHVRIYANV